MRTVTFQSVLDGAAARIGLDPTQTIQPSTASALTEYINTRTRFAWEAYKWPELSAIEKRQFRSTFDAAVVYPVGAEVFYLGQYYRKIAAGLAGVLPTVTATWTSAATLNDFVRSIDFDQTFTATSATTNATPIGEVMHVYRQDPRVVRYAERVNFWVTDSGAIVGPTQFTNATPNEVYVEFTIRPTMFNTSSNDEDFPRVISEYVKFSAAADALRDVPRVLRRGDRRRPRDVREGDGGARRREEDELEHVGHLDVGRRWGPSVAAQRAHRAHAKGDLVLVEGTRAAVDLLAQHVGLGLQKREQVAVAPTR
jgi:hypothetical protein